MKKDALYYQYNLIIILTLALTSFALIGINLVIDPYNYFELRVTGFNKIKPNENNQIRISKLLALRRIQPDVIVLGSSRVLSGIDVDVPALKDAGVAHNLGITGARIDELMYYLQYAVTHNHRNKPKTVILGIDFYMFNQAEYPEIEFIKNNMHGYFPVLDVGKTTFSFNALNASHKTLEHNLKSHSKNSTSPSKILESFEYWLNAFLDKNTWYRDYTLSPEKLNAFKKIVKICQENNIELIVFISPAHATDTEVINLLELWPIFEKWKREAVKVTPVWDFSGYNSVTTEPISEKMVNYNDSSHYTTKVGSLVLNRVLSYQTEQMPDDFGVLVNSNNIASHLENIRSDREQWKKNHTPDFKFLQDVQKSQKK